LFPQPPHEQNLVFKPNRINAQILIFFVFDQDRKPDRKTRTGAVLSYIKIFLQLDSALHLAKIMNLTFDPLSFKRSFLQIKTVIQSSQYIKHRAQLTGS